MKKLFLLTLVFVACLMVRAQESILRDVDNALLQKYIELAQRNYPKKKLVEAREVVAKANLAEAQTSYLDIFNGGYYWSPRSENTVVGGVAANNQIIQRGFMAGVSVNLGSLLAKPSRVKAAKANYEAAKADMQDYNTTLITEVKSRYYDYLLMKKQLELNYLSAQNSKTIFSDTKLKFEKGEITVDQYTVAKTANDQTEALLLSSEVAYLKAKNALEDLIGTKLENVR